MPSYPKKEKTKLSDHFWTQDFDCKCDYPDCITTLIDSDLLDPLEELWTLSGGFIIDSGFRCSKHNYDIGGVINSQHLLGKAADCRSTKNYNGNLMAKYAEEITKFKNGGIGIYPNFTHVDIRNGKARWGNLTKC